MTNKVYMVTIPRSGIVKKRFFEMIEQWDIHKWVYAVEKGKHGYKHVQGRFQTSKSFEEIKKQLPGAHIEEASDTWEYERKGGRYLTSEDTPEIIKVRFGKPRRVQIYAERVLQSTNDREVMVWIDEQGNCGKTWFTIHLWETGKACYVPPTLGTPKEIIQWVHSAYNHEPYIIIDIPRSWKWNEALYTAIETVKDGLVYDPRYTARMRNIRGVKVMCVTNTCPKLDKLSADRWILFEPNKILEKV